MTIFRNFYFRSFALVLLLIMVLCFSAQAGNDWYKTTLRGAELAMGNKMDARDSWYSYMQLNSDWYNYAGGPVDYTKFFANRSATGRVSLRYDGSENLLHTNPWELIVSYHVKAYGAAGNVLLERDESLTITFDPAYQSSQVDVAVLEYPDAHRLDIEITHLCGQPDGNPNLAEDFLLEGSIEVERYFILDDQRALQCGHQIRHQTGGSGENTAVEFNWEYSPGAEEYELQYVHVSDQLTGSLQVQDLLDFDNATRIVTPDPFFSLIPVYERGTIFYRVRPRGRQGTDFLAVHPGRWSTEGAVVLEPVQNNSTDIVAYEMNHNWTHQTTHGELGKHVETVAFFDGIGNARQTVTRDNENDLAIVQENLMDYEGRSAVALMPTPVLPATMSATNLAVRSPLKFYNNFSLTHSDNIQFNKQHFDLDSNRDNPTGLAATGPERAGSYYSAANPLSDYGFYRYLPSAVGDNGAYTYSRTLYDDQGRIKVQSGVGPEYRIGGEHTTEYYYGTPSQEKLNRLFGTEIGYAEHYRKNLTKDANGQLAVRYETLAGRVVATALVGEVPTTNGLPIASPVDQSDGIVGIITEDLSNHNAYNEADQEWEIAFTKLVTTVPSGYLFQYELDLTNELYSINCGGTPYNYGCEYYLDLQLTDPEGDPIAFTGWSSVGVLTVDGLIKSNLVAADFPVLVHYGQNYQIDLDAYLTEVGNYTLTKSLRLKGEEAVMEAYESFVRDPANGCAALLPVEYTCAGPDYEKEETINLGSGEHCDLLLDILQTDMSPGGQYFDNLENGVGDPATINHWLEGTNYGGPNVLGPGGAPVQLGDFRALENILAAGGIELNINSIAEGWNAFREYWWMEEVRAHLLGTGSGDWRLHQLHPEYPHYEWCQDTDGQASNNENFNRSIQDFSTVQSAWISQLQGLANSNCPTTTLLLLQADPYWNSSMGDREVSDQLSGRELLQELICSYPEDIDLPNPREFSMWEVAEYEASQNPDLNGTSPTTAQIWEVFVGHYLSTKQKIINLQKENPCDNASHSPFLYDRNTVEQPLDFVADDNRQHAIYRWGNAAYELGSKPPGHDNFPLLYQDWYQGCTRITQDNALVERLIQEWNGNSPQSDYNEHLELMDDRALNFMIRVPDLQRSFQDLVEGDGPAQNDIYGANDEWNEWAELAGELDPCDYAAAAMIPFPDVVFPPEGATVGDLRSVFVVPYSFENPAGDCVPMYGNNPVGCINLIVDRNYFSFADFYHANQSFFDCVVATINDHTSVPYDFEAIHTPTHIIIQSPDHHESFPTDFKVFTEPNCSCASNFRSRVETRPETSFNRSGGASAPPVQRRRAIFAQLEECYPFTSPCEEGPIHCLCEDYYAAQREAVGTGVENLYAGEYGATASEWVDYLSELALRCDNFIYNPAATEQDIEDAIMVIEDLADGTRDLATLSPDKPAPIPLTCFELAPDPCDEGRAIALYEVAQIYQESIEGLIQNFRERYRGDCIDPERAPDQLRMTYLDKEYHYTLYYYTPDGNLYATVPPEGVRPLSENDPGLALVNDKRDLGWGTSEVPLHRRNPERHDQLMTLYKYDSYDNVVRSQTPDHESGSINPTDGYQAYGESLTLYDDLGRPRFTQDPRLLAEGAVTYNRYDDQGRVIESGRLEWASNFVNLSPYLNDQAFPQANSYVLSERLRQTYDAVTGFSPGAQENLRQRLVKSEYYETENALSHATHYSYDVQGNVKTLWQEDRHVRDLGGFIKRMDYDFGVVDGLVYRFDYQPGEGDAYSHRYCYDANNRIQEVWTSDGGGIWDRDQSSFYRYEGVQARMEVGEYRVQGMDYVYTLQGWIKGINASSNLASRDLGNDGATSSGDPYNRLHRWSGRDAYAYTLYYNPTDYASIHNFSPGDRFYADLPSNGGIFTEFSVPIMGMYNGNIAAMHTALVGPNGSPQEHLLKGYGYDQLMRLKEARTKLAAATPGSVLSTSNSWAGTGSESSDYYVGLDFDKNGNIERLTRNGYAAGGLAMDNLTYEYQNENSYGAVFNKLNHVKDLVPGRPYGNDFGDQSADNYTYDAIGNLIGDRSEEIDRVIWNIQGKVKYLQRTAGSTRPDLEYRYDSQGNRIEKIVKTKTPAGALQSEIYWTSTHYVRDASGNVIATYDKDYARPQVDGNSNLPDLLRYANEVYLRRVGSGLSLPSDPSTLPELQLNGENLPIEINGYDYVEVMRWREAHLYGSTRLGLEQKDDLVALTHFAAFPNLSTGELEAENTFESYEAIPIDRTIVRRLGGKRYEMANHLGNVLVVVTDRRMAVSLDGQTVDHYAADVVKATDYYPYGMEMVGRSVASDGYRYGFNGKENDREWGDQLIQDYGFRLYNLGLGKFLSVDPLAPEYPWYTPYQFAGNMPIWAVDIDGLEPGFSSPPIGGAANPANPKFARPPSGGSARADSFIEGFQNTVFGVVGAVASGAYIIGSTGIGMAAGGGLALTLSIGEIGIGVAQMIDALKNDAPANVSEAIKSTSTLPGMAVYPFDKEAASIVDAGSQFVVGTLTGGNFKTLMENPAKIRGAFTEEGFALLSADSKEVAKLAYDVLSFTDAAMDTRGLGQAQAQMVDGIIHSTINGLSEFATPVTPEENILSHDYFYSKFISDRSNSPYPTSAIHRVVSGETLTSIARLYGTTVENIAVQNNIKNRNVIHVGQRLNFQLTTPSVNQNNNQ